MMRRAGEPQPGHTMCLTSGLTSSSAVSLQSVHRKRCRMSLAIVTGAPKLRFDLGLKRALCTQSLHAQPNVFFVAQHFAQKCEPALSAIEVLRLFRARAKLHLHLLC